MSSFWGGRNGNGFSTTTTLTSNKMRRQQSSLVFRTIAGSLVAGACGYYGAHIVVFEIFCVPFLAGSIVFQFCSFVLPLSDLKHPFYFFLSFFLFLSQMMMMMTTDDDKKSRARSKTRRITGSFKKRRRGTRARFTR